MRFENPLQFDVEECFLHNLSQMGEPLPIFTSERLCLSKTFLLPLT